MNHYRSMQRLPLGRPLRASWMPWRCFGGGIPILVPVCYVPFWSDLRC